MLYYGVSISAAMISLPFFLILTLANAMAVGLWLSALNVRYRDVRYAIPFLTQLWMYATPIAYSIELIPEKWHWLYSLNPMVGVVEGFRWAMLGESSLDTFSLGVSAIVVIIFLVSGLYYFKQLESTFADVI
jgi:lipopolysaccharide transport system permease protein